MAGLIWFEGSYGTMGHLEALYIWLWIIARLRFSMATKVRSRVTARLLEFLGTWRK